MARIRSIKPEFFTSLAIGGLSERARLAFIGIWTYVDDHGRAVDDPRLVKAAVFPLDDKITTKVVADLLDELAAAGRLKRYEVGGRAYIAVTNWEEHQKPSHPAKSRIPPPPSCVTPESSGGTPEERRKVPEILRPEQGAGSREQGAGSSSTREPEADAGAPEDLPAAAAAAIEMILAIRERQQQARIAHPVPWREQTRPKIAEEYLPRLLATLEQRPTADAPDLVLACGFSEWS